MTVIQDKPSIEEVMEHFGKKGMHWGDRNVESSSTSDGSSKPGMSKKKKVAIAVGGGVLLVGGAAVAHTLLKKHGMNLMEAETAKGIKDKLGYKLKVTNKHGTSTYGVDAVKAFDKHVWNQKVKDFDSIIAKSHDEQTTYMRDAIKNLGGQYVVRNNPYAPQARIALTSAHETFVRSVPTH